VTSLPCPAGGRTAGKFLGVLQEQTANGARSAAATPRQSLIITRSPMAKWLRLKLPPEARPPQPGPAAKRRPTLRPARCDLLSARNCSLTVSALAQEVPSCEKGAPMPVWASAAKRTGARLAALSRTARDRVRLDDAGTAP